MYWFIALALDLFLMVEVSEVNHENSPFCLPAPNGAENIFLYLSVCHFILSKHDNINPIQCWTIY